MLVGDLEHATAEAGYARRRTGEVGGVGDQEGNNAELIQVIDQLEGPHLELPAVAEHAVQASPARTTARRATSGGR